jgi:hypothetical protein
MNRRSRRTRSAGHFKNKTKKSASSAFFSRRWFRTDFTQDCFPQIYADEPQISQNTLGWAFQKQNKKSASSAFFSRRWFAQILHRIVSRRFMQMNRRSRRTRSAGHFKNKTKKIRVIRVIRVPFKNPRHPRHPRSF